MANTILTPVTLWKDFDDSLPLSEEIFSERTEDGVTVQDVYFYGRQTETGRVKIYARYMRPANGERFPAVMILFEAPLAFDETFASRFLSNGYAVLLVDYCGDNGTDRHTVYPEDVDYANFIRAGRHIDYADETARETSWYEWAGVARYAARYLSEKEEVTAAGAIGLRTGGEVLFKIAPFAPLACMISVCAAGWLAYRDVGKFTGDKTQALNEERYRFIAGIDSQSYAPYVKCPVLLLSAVNDKKYNYDRVYDTFRLLNPEVEKAILFSAHGNGLIGSHSFNDLDLFLDKYLKRRSVFVSKPISFSAEEDGEGNLVVKGVYDEAGEIEECGIFFTEKFSDSRARDWTRVLGKAEGNIGIMPLSLYHGCEKALVYTFAHYSNDFSVTSKIQEVSPGKRYKNSVPKTRAIYSSAADGLNGFTSFRRRQSSLADCFMRGNFSDPKLAAGYGGIQGITSSAGLMSYRVSEPRYAPHEGAALRFDAYAREEARLFVTFYLDSAEENGYTAEVGVEGGGSWKSILFDPLDFKSETGASLTDFSGVVSLVFNSGKEVLINNVLWI